MDETHRDRDSGHETPIPVSEKILARTARRHGVAPGELWDALDALDSSHDLHDLPGRLRDPLRVALDSEARERVTDHRETWHGAAAHSREFGAVVTVEHVFRQSPEEVIDGIVPLSVRTPDGRIETTSASTLIRGGVECAGRGCERRASETIDGCRLGNLRYELRVCGQCARESERAAEQ